MLSFTLLSFFTTPIVNLEQIQMMIRKRPIVRAKMARCLPILFVIASVFLFILPVSAAPGSTEATWKAPDVDGKQALAVYSGGGKVTVEQAIAWAKKMTGSSRRVHMFTSPEEMYQKAAKSIAIEQIMLAKAKELKIEEVAGWPVAEKLIESKGLFSLFYDVNWANYTPTQQEMDKFAEENPAMAAIPRPSDGPDYDPATAKLEYQRPNKRDWLIWQMRGQHSSQVMGAFYEEADKKYAVDCVKWEDWAKAEDDAVLLKSGKIALTKKNIQDLAEISGKKIETCWGVFELGDHTDSSIALAEFAREKDYAKRDDYPATLKYAKEEWIVAVMKARMLEGLLTSFVPSDQDIKTYYDNEYKGMQDQIMKCDFIVCPVDYSDPSTSEPAKALAAELIMKMQQGAKFEDLLKEHPECRYEPPAERHVQPQFSGGFNSPAIAGTSPGGVALDSIEDYGGYCVIRVLENNPPAKIPLEYARGACITELEFRNKNEMTGDTDGTILKKYGFTIQKSVLDQLSKDKS